MNCRELRGAAWAYAEGELPEARRAEYEAHAEACPECGVFVATCRELTCQQFTEFLDDYVDAALAPERRAVFERHLAICPDCVEYLRSYRVTRDLTSGLGAEEPAPADVPEDLIRAILKARDEA